MAFFSIIVVLSAALHYYLWARLIRDTTAPGRWRRVGTIAIAGLGIFATVTFMITRTVAVDAWWLAWPGYTWIGLLFYLLIVLLILEVPRMILAFRWRSRNRKRSRPSASLTTKENTLVTADGQEDADAETPAGESASSGPASLLDRRVFIARAFAATAGITAACTVGYGMYTAFSDLRTVRATVPLRGLHSSASGFRIALVSDTHFGPLIHEEMAARVVRHVNRQQVDMVAIVGDLVDGTIDAVGHKIDGLRHLKSRLGTYFVTGNHEYSSGADSWLERVRELGMTPLLNDRVEIPSGRAAFNLAGVNDIAAPMYDASGPDYDQALSDRDPAHPVVLLAHQPVQVFDAIEHGVDLQLSGHTHGGQTVPFDRITGLQQPVVSGLASMSGTSIFVTRGAGFFGPPVRVGVPPEIAIIELQAR
ncbi:metallophosphoesterase [Phytoactinopolyspora limicola]|uniref:metallophosphoesterase n=1 Tax=Phytoactinopolyspora limicola TaxID=2715536 RepID=UPI001A9C7BEA|nr:metallophosphoesterase [Phytoactinopolyspora limicola]